MGLLVISNTSYINGFISIFYPDVLAQLAEEKNTNLIIIPSSIHEALVFPDYGQIKTEQINEMIIEINRTQVIEEEQLSEEAYYDKDSKALFLMKDYKEGNRTLFIKI